jgi:triosephosphate isomerase
MRTKIVIANWKMKLEIPESVQLAKKLKLAFLKKLWQGQVILCPDFLSLPTCGQALLKSKIKLGAQNCFWQDKGSYTGEVSINNLRNLKVEYVILGHSERRRYFKESNLQVASKAKLVLTNNITPIVCIGESLSDYRNKKTLFTLKKQLKGSLQGIKLKTKEKLIIAYEPVWAIGSGKSLEAKQVAKILKFLKEETKKIPALSKMISSIFFIYGGSVNSQNVQNMATFKDIQGLLVGSDSLQVKSFTKICQDFLS